MGAKGLVALTILIYPRLTKRQTNNKGEVMAE